MVSRKNIKYKAQQDAKRVPHYGIRKLSIGVASVLLGTVFYMQNGTVHADVNPTVSTGNDNVNVVNKDSGTSGSAGVASTSTGVSLTNSDVGSANSAGSMVSTGDATNSMVPSQASGSPVEGATKQVNNSDWVASKLGSATPASQVNVGTDNSNAISSLPPASHHQAASGNQSSERLSANLSLPVNQKLNTNISSLLASKVALTGSNNAVNGGFDRSTWGTLDVSKWTGQENNGVYELTGYTLANAEFTVVKRTLSELDTNDAFALNPANGLHEHANVNDNGGYDTDFWGTLDVSKFMTVKNGDDLEITGYTGDSSKVIIPNIADFWADGSDQGAKQVTISSSAMHTLAKKATRIGLSKTNNQKVVAGDANWSNAFKGYLNELNLMDLHNLDTTNITNMSQMFYGGFNLKVVGDLSQWNTANVTDMSGMFSGASALTNVGNLDNWDTSNVTDMSGMFSGASALTNIGDLSQWNTANVTGMSIMFGGASGLTNIGDLDNWNTSKVTDMGSMFSFASALTNIGDLSKWDVSNVAIMIGMFFHASALKQLNISNWDLTKLMGKECFQSFVTGDPNLVVIANNIKLPTWYQNELNSSNDFWNDHLAVITNNEALLKASGSVDNIMVDGASVKRSVFYDSKGSSDAVAVLKQANQAYSKQYQNEHPGNILTLASDVDQTDPIALANAKFVVKRTLSELDTNDAFALNPANGLHEHKNVNDNGGYDTDFWGTLDVSKFTTVKNGDNLEITGYTGDSSKVIIPNIADFEINGLDQGAKQVTISSSVMHELAKNAMRIGLSKTNNQKVVAGDANWQDAFGGMTYEPNTSSNANGGMWVYNPNLAVMDLHNLDTTNITNMDSMFNGGHNLNVVGDLSQWNVANVADMTVMFQEASLLTNIGDLDNWNTSKVTDMTGMFNHATSLTNIGDLSKWKTGNVTNMHNMFTNATNLTSIGNLDNWNTSKVTDMSWMFGTESGKQSHLTNIGDLSKWQTGNVTDMSFMFANVANLTNLGDLSKWNTSKVTDMHWMFGGTTNLTNIGNLNNWDTSTVTDMNSMFYNATNLTNIGNLDNWDTSNVTDMHWMFGVDSGKQSHLTNIGDLSKWQTGNVTNMNRMFTNATNLTSIGNLDNWNTSKVTDMSWMFGGTTNLTNIGNLNNWDTSKVTDMNSMFYNATNLINIGNLNNWNTSKVTNMMWMFGYATHLTNIGDLSKWQTGNVTNISYMFVSTNPLRHLNISNWDLTKLANKDSMKCMFANDTDLTIIANDLALPVWYQNEINDADYFWNHHIAVITNVPELIRATGDIDSLKIDNQDASRSIFYDSRGSSDAVAVLKQANQAYIKQYQNEHPGYTLTLAADVDQTDPIALANANFISAPREVQFTIAYYDLTGKLIDSTTSTHKVGDTVSISPVVPDNYALANGQLGMNYLMRWGLNEADFLVEPKVTTITETKTVSRTITVQTPDGQFNNVVQTVTFVRNSYLNQVTKQTTYSPWSFGGQYQFSGYQPKSMSGYTADVISAVIVTPDSLNTTVNVAYHKIPVVYEIDYQLANGKLVTKAQGVATGDGTIHLTAPQGYRLLTPVTDVQVDHSSQKLKVLVLPDEQTYTAYSTLPSSVTEPLTKTITRTINITMPNGRVRKVVQQVHFIRTATVVSNGKITYSNWTGVGQTSFDRLFVPKRRGYRLVMTDNQDQTLIGVNQMVVDPMMNNVVINVKYVK